MPPLIPDRTSTEIRTPDDAEPDNIAFSYEHPLVSVDTAARTAEHTLLLPDTNEDTMERGPQEPVTQFLGTEPTKITLRGHCYLDEANQIDQLAQGQRVRLISERASTRAIVNSASTDPRGSGGGVRESVSDRIYDYNIEMVESEEAFSAPTSRDTLAALDARFERNEAAFERDLLAELLLDQGLTQEEIDIILNAL